MDQLRWDVGEDLFRLIAVYDRAAAVVIARAAVRGEDGAEKSARARLGGRHGQLSPPQLLVDRGHALHELLERRRALRGHRNLLCQVGHAATVSIDDAKHSLSALKTRRATKRFSARRASRAVRPSARRRARYARAGSYVRACVSTIWCRNMFRRRLPMRFSRWRVPPALEASSGATPEPAAKCSSRKPCRGRPHSATTPQAMSGPTAAMRLTGEKRSALVRSSFLRSSRCCVSSCWSCSPGARE